MEISSILIQHLGLVAGMFDLLGIDEVIDRILPKKRHHKLPHSVVVKAMILNGLGFTGQRLYLFPNFFRTIPVEHLLGEGICADDLNDDVVGRTLDAIFEYGPTEFFNEISFHVMKTFSMGTELIHTDTTNFSVYGKYETDAPDATDSIKITFGHAKDGRTDLKRFVLGMVVNSIGIPLFAKAYSGNESDKKSIIEMIRKTQAAIQIDPLSIWIADSAVYTEENIQLLGTETLWITRVPATVKEAASLLASELNMVPGSDPRYTFYSTEIVYGGVRQRAAVVWSQEKQDREDKTFAKKLQQIDSNAKKDLKRLSRMEFVCIPDAENAAKQWLAEHPHHRFREMAISTITGRLGGKRGRPKKDEPLKTRYKISATIDIDPEAVAKERIKLGRFVLASNKLDLEPEEMLAHYKKQHTVEKGFRFLKDKSFHVSEIYLKKEERIQSLAVIMVLNLLIYSFSEFKLRARLKETGMTIPNQIKKPTQRPTMRWVFEIFRGIIRTTVTDDGRIVGETNNLDDVQRLILSLMGAECEKYYLGNG